MLVDRLELGDRLIVVAVLEIAHLNLVDPLEFVELHAEFTADLRGGLCGPQRHRMRNHRRPMSLVPGKRTGLFTSEIGELGTGRAGVDATFDVAVRLPVPDEHQPPAHSFPFRSCVSHRDASSSGGGAAPAADPVGHEPRYRTSAQRRCSALSASATASSSMCPTQSRKKM